MTTIRTAGDNDDRNLADLDASSWPPHLQVSPSQPASEPFFTAWRRPDDVLVAEVEDRIVGYVRVGRHLRLASNDHVLHIEALVVAHGARGQGIGATLVDAAVAEARRRGVWKLGLRALSTNLDALRLYERHGFVEEGRLRAELARPDGSYADDVWLAMWLAPPPARS